MHPYPQYFPVRGENDRLDVVSVLAEGFDLEPDRLRLLMEGEAWTTGEVGVRVLQVQKWLEKQGLRPGDRVAVLLDSHPDHVALIYALILSGVVWIPINTRSKALGIAYVLGHCGADLVVHENKYGDLISETLQLAGKQIRKELLPAFDPVGGEGRPSVYWGDPHSPLCIIYTSGTTGEPKGVVFTHRMLRVASEAALMVADARDGDRLFLWEPLCHIGGAQMLLVPFLRRVDLYLVPGFSAGRFWNQVRKSGATHLHYLGGILDILLARDIEESGEHSLRVAWGAGVNVKSWDAVGSRFGMQLRECYGMTEASSFTTVNTTGKPGSIGRTVPWIKLQLLDDQDRPVDAGEIGQIVISTDVDGAFFPGYLDNPSATERALRNGRLYTGDLARIDTDGDLFFVGRTSDSMRVRGENVSSWEIERVFMSHPSIAAVAAVGVPASIGEQDILLFIQWQSGKVAEFDSIAKWAEHLLPGFQQPRYYKAVPGFEVTPSERIRKHLLAKDVTDAWDRLAG